MSLVTSEDITSKDTKEAKQEKKSETSTPTMSLTATPQPLMVEQDASPGIPQSVFIKKMLAFFDWREKQIKEEIKAQSEVLEKQKEAAAKRNNESKEEKDLQVERTQKAVQNLQERFARLQEQRKQLDTEKQYIEWEEKAVKLKRAMEAELKKRAQTQRSTTLTAFEVDELARQITHDEDFQWTKFVSNPPAGAGLCHGLFFTWAFSRYLQEQKGDHQNMDDYTWFQTTMQKIARWNTDEAPDTNLAKEMERLFELSKQFNVAQSKMDLYQIGLEYQARTSSNIPPDPPLTLVLEDFDSKDKSKHRTLKEEYKIEGNFTVEEFNALTSRLVQNAKGKIMHVFLTTPKGEVGHALGYYYSPDGKLFCYDPNETVKGQLIKKNLSLGAWLFATWQSANQKEKIRLDIYGIHPDQKAGDYPTLRECVEACCQISHIRAEDCALCNPENFASACAQMRYQDAAFLYKLNPDEIAKGYVGDQAAFTFAQLACMAEDPEMLVSVLKKYPITDPSLLSKIIKRTISYFAKAVERDDIIKLTMKQLIEIDASKEIFDWLSLLIEKDNSDKSGEKYRRAIKLTLKEIACQPKYQDNLQRYLNEQLFSCIKSHRNDQADFLLNIMESIGIPFDPDKCIENLDAAIDHEHDEVVESLLRKIIDSGKIPLRCTASLAKLFIAAAQQHNRQSMEGCVNLLSKYADKAISSYFFYNLVDYHSSELQALSSDPNARRVFLQRTNSLLKAYLRNQYQESLQEQKTSPAAEDELLLKRLENCTNLPQILALYREVKEEKAASGIKKVLQKQENLMIKIDRLLKKMTPEATTSPLLISSQANSTMSQSTQTTV